MFGFLYHHMYWWLLYLVYVLINIAGVYYLHRYFSARINNKLLVWLFSLSLSLGLSALWFLLLLSLFLHYIHLTF